VLLGFWHNDAKDTVLHACLDGVLVNSSREAKGASKFSYAAFRNPEFGLFLWLLRLLFLGRVGSGGVFVGGILVLDCGFVTVGLLTTFGDGARCLSSFDEVAGRCAGCVRSLGAASDGQGLGIGELDLNVLLFNAGKFTVQLVCVGHLLDIESRLEGPQVASVVMSITTGRPGVGVEVIEETEERGEGWIGAYECAREERHLACNCWLEDSLSGSDW